jgi:hypothetical protein
MKPQQRNGTTPRIRAAMSLYESRGIAVDEEKNKRKKEKTSTLKDSTRERSFTPQGVLWEEQLLET